MPYILSYSCLISWKKYQRNMNFHPHFLPAGYVFSSNMHNEQTNRFSNIEFQALAAKVYALVSSDILTGYPTNVILLVFFFSALQGGAFDLTETRMTECLTS